MTKFKVITDFQWGKLKLNKGQIISIEQKSDGSAVVLPMFHSDLSQLISSKAVESMVFLKKIEKC